ncbi:MAG: SCO family protein, partial [Bryobacteraceae bacterium]
MRVDAFLLSALCVLINSCTRTPPLPVYGQVPDFALTAETGQPLTRGALDGKVWAANFIFTSCSGPCPRMSSLMKQLQQASAGLPDVRMVS